MRSTTQPLLGLSSTNFVNRLKNFEKTINSFVKRPNKNYVAFKIHLLPFLPETLIVMMKSDVITKHLGLPIMV